MYELSRELNGGARLEMVHSVKSLEDSREGPLKILSEDIIWSWS
jgi:hypothetical protein